MNNWIIYEPDEIGTTNCRCPYCKEEFFFPRIKTEPYPFCPACGERVVTKSTNGTDCAWQMNWSEYEAK